MPKIRSIVSVPKTQTNSTLNQAGAVQNTYYDVLPETKNCRVLSCFVNCTVANEDLEVEVIIDGVTFSDTQAGAIAGTAYYVSLHPLGNALLGTTPLMMHFNGTYVEGRTFQIRVRKTSAVGASALQGTVVYQKW